MRAKIKMPTARDLYPLGPERKPIDWLAILKFLFGKGSK